MIERDKEKASVNTKLIFNATMAFFIIAFCPVWLVLYGTAAAVAVWRRKRDTEFTALWGVHKFVSVSQ